MALILSLNAKGGAWSTAVSRAIRGGTPESQANPAVSGQVK
jgi:hypothetical protein